MDMDGEELAPVTDRRHNIRERAARTNSRFSNEKGSAAGVRILSSAEFTAGYVAPDYLIDRLVQRRYLYSLTAPTGAGKTAIALLIAMLVAEGRPLGELAIERGRALIFAGENPDDVRARWMAMAEHFEFDVDQIPVHFMPGKFSIPDLMYRIEAEARTVGGFALIIIDTSATYFDGDDENDNVQAGNHARMVRELTKLPGGPCIIVNCHPTKNASPDNLLPRGGGAFLNEVDGNLTCTGTPPLAELSWQGKLRGPGFEPISFEMVAVTCERVRDSKGRHIPTVIARPLSERDQKEIAVTSRRDQNALLMAMLDNEGASFAALCEALTWKTSTGKPHKSKLSRVMKILHRDKLVKKIRETWTLTDTGKKEAGKAKQNSNLAGAKYS